MLGIYKTTGYVHIRKKESMYLDPISYLIRMLPSLNNQCSHSLFIVHWHAQVLAQSGLQSLLHMTRMRQR